MYWSEEGKKAEYFWWAISTLFLGYTTFFSVLPHSNVRCHTEVVTQYLTIQREKPHRRNDEARMGDAGIHDLFTFVPTGREHSRRFRIGVLSPTPEGMGLSKLAQ